MFSGRLSSAPTQNDINCVSPNWFQWSDQPAQGRFDGENGNYGLVKENDEPWELLTQRMTKVNGEIEAIYRGKV